jgi:hypothetical protein
MATGATAVGAYRRRGSGADGMNEAMTFVVIAAPLLVFFVLDRWWMNRLRRDVDRWNAERPEDDPRKRQLW